MDYKLLMETAVLAGEIMLKSGAETYRVEDTIYRMLRVTSLENIDAFVIPTGIVATLDGQSVQGMTIVKRVPNRSLNMNRIYFVNEVSRQLCDGRITVQEANHKLKTMKERLYPPFLRDLALVAATMSFAILFGGGWAEMLGAGLCGFLLALWMHLINKKQVNTFFKDITAAFISAVGAILFHRVFPMVENIDTVIISGIMPLVPGAAITNAIRDTLQGDYVSGCAKVLEAFVIAAAIASGVAAAITLMGGV